MGWSKINIKRKLSTSTFNNQDRFVAVIQIAIKYHQNIIRLITKNNKNQPK